MWKTIVSFLFPKYCVNCKTLGNYLCDKCFSYIDFDSTPICPVCRKKSTEGSTHLDCTTSYSMNGLLSAVRYNQVIRRLIYKYKYPPYISDLTEVIGQLMCESLAQNEKFYSLLKKEPLLIPVPLHRRSLARRGYNQASLLCSYVAQYFNLDCNSTLIIRTRNTEFQRTVHPLQRSSHVLDAFSITNQGKQKVTGRTMVVLDDTVLTCSTLREIAKVLKKHGAKEVWGVVFTREIYKKRVGLKINPV